MSSRPTRDVRPPITVLKGRVEEMAKEVKGRRDPAQL